MVLLFVPEISTQQSSISVNINLDTMSIQENVIPNLFYRFAIPGFGQGRPSGMLAPGRARPPPEGFRHGNYELKGKHFLRSGPDDSGQRAVAWILQAVEAQVHETALELPSHRFREAIEEDQQGGRYSHGGFLFLGN